MFKQRACALVGMLLLSTICLFAQDEREYEVFVGYSNLQAEGLRDTNNSPDRRATMHGFNADGTLVSVLDLGIGITGDVSFNRQSRSVDVVNGTDSEHTDVWYFMGGPSYAFASTERLQPFIRLLAGAARTKYVAKQTRTGPTADRTSTFELGTVDFAMAFGGGLDVKINDRFKVRAIQVDYVPVFLGDRAMTIFGQQGVLRTAILEGQRQDNFRFSFGVTF